jgi:hypothetical protein
MLAQDDQFQGIESWLTRAPMPRPPRESWPLYVAYRERVTDARASYDVLKSSHWVDAHEYDECQSLMAQTFVSNTFGSQRSVPSYDEWYLRQDHGPSFERLAANLRVIGSTDTEGRRWLLKNPSHLFSLDALFAVFPDAHVVITHRDPLRAVPSVCSLLWTIRQARGLNAPDLDPKLIGRRELRMWSTALRRAQRVIETRPGQVHHVPQDELQREPLAVIDRLLDQLGIGLGPQGRARLVEWIEQDHQGSRGEHRYDAATFGLTTDQIAEEFADYRARYGFGSASKPS